MAHWRFDTSNYFAATVKDFWPDVRKTAIYSHLLEWDIDAANLLVATKRLKGGSATMGITVTRMGQPYMTMDPVRLEKAYPTDEAKYIALVHELAHVEQLITGEWDVSRPSIASMVSWAKDPIEQAAVRWSARQAKLMGWSPQRLDALFKSRYSGYHDDEPEFIPTVLQHGRIGIGMDPQQETLVILRRRPVRVRQYTRRKR